MERITAPILVCLASDDVEVSGHFDLHHGAVFEQVAADQTAFLRTHLRPD